MSLSKTPKPPNQINRKVLTELPEKIVALCNLNGYMYVAYGNTLWHGRIESDEFKQVYFVIDDDESTVVSQDSDLKEKFEVWQKSMGHCPIRVSAKDMDYQTPTMQAQWEGWKACADAYGTHTPGSQISPDSNVNQGSCL